MSRAGFEKSMFLDQVLDALKSLKSQNLNMKKVQDLLSPGVKIPPGLITQTTITGRPKILYMYSASVPNRSSIVQAVLKIPSQPTDIYVAFESTNDNLKKWKICKFF